MKELTTQEKELILKELCTRLPYGIVINVGDKDLKLDKKHQCIGVLYPEDCSDEFNERHNNASFYIVISGCYYGEEIKPYLRPLSSMTEEEILELYKIAYNTWYNDSLYYKSEEWISFRDSIQNNTLCFKSSIWASDIFKVYDWLNSNNFDYNGLIPMGLGIDCTGLNIYDSSIKV